MATLLTVSVADEQRALYLLKELEARPDVIDVTINRTPAESLAGDDDIALASEASLAQAWNSPEDDVWDSSYEQFRGTALQDQLGLDSEHPYLNPDPNNGYWQSEGKWYTRDADGNRIRHYPSKAELPD